MALEGFDTVLSYKSGAVYVPLAGIVNTSGPKPTYGVIERSSNFSRQVRKVPGQLDGGQIELELEYDSTQTTTLASLHGVKDTVFRIEHSDGSGWDFTGFLSALGEESPHDGDIKQSATFEISDGPTPLAL